MNISKSRINTLSRCGQLFDFIYNQKIESEETGIMGKGTKFHLWSEELDKHLKEMLDEKEIKEYLEFLHKTSIDDWEKYYINDRLELLQKCIIEKPVTWREYFHPIYNEFAFKIDIEGNTYRCICDRIWKTFTDELMLVELKTGVAEMEDVRKELAISKIIIDSTLNCDIKWFGLINPNLKITATEKVKKVSITYAKKSIQKFISIVTSGIYTKNLYLCGTCSFAEKCYNFKMFNEDKGFEL